MYMDRAIQRTFPLKGLLSGYWHVPPPRASLTRDTREQGLLRSQIASWLLMPGWRSLSGWGMIIAIVPIGVVVRILFERRTGPG